MRCCSRATGTSQDFWHQFGNSIYIGVVTMALNVAIGSAASFALGRMRLEPRLGVVERGAARLRRPGVFSRDPVLPPHAQPTG